MGAVDGNHRKLPTRYKEIDMKKRTVARTLIAALLAVGLVGGGSAYAFRGDGACGPQGMERMGRMEGNPGKFAGKRLEKLHADLKLAPEQEAAWKAWSEPLRQQAEAMGDRRAEHEQMMKLPAPERMEKMLERMKEHQQKMEAQLASLRTFYSQLSAEQKKTFDAFQPFGGPRHGHDRGGPRRGGEGPQGGRN